VSRGLIPVLATAWRQRIPWYPGDWIWPVLGSLVVAALGAAIAILATTDNGSSTKTTAGTGPVPANTAGPPPPETDTSTVPTETAPTESVPTTTEPEEPPPPPPSTELIEWPAGQSGWTIVLSSSPQSSGRAAAASIGQQAIDAGLTDVGVLNSDEYSSLHPGYFVVFTGIYSSESEARGALDAAKGFKPQAYPREITQ
jgi:hypothetical protein